MGGLWQHGSENQARPVRSGRDPAGSTETTSFVAYKKRATFSNLLPAPSPIPFRFSNLLPSQNTSLHRRRPSVALRSFFLRPVGFSNCLKSSSFTLFALTSFVFIFSNRLPLPLEVNCSSPYSSKLLRSKVRALKISLLKAFCVLKILFFVILCRPRLNWLDK